MGSTSLRRIAEDEKALSRACDMIQKRWRAKNSRGLGGVRGDQAAGEVGDGTVLNHRRGDP
jgi:hypothetical protein